jgi:hypothetical protein
MKLAIPENEYPEYFKMYLALVDEDILLELETQLDTYVKFVQEISAEKELFRYAPTKWTIREVIGHNTDTERIKLDCALRIARNDKAPIPGFDEDAYVLATDFNSRTLDDLLEEFVYVRKSAISLYKSFRDEDLKRIGTASNKAVSARALFGFLIGHIRHHENVIKERYLR